MQLVALYHNPEQAIWMMATTQQVSSAVCSLFFFFCHCLTCLETTSDEIGNSARLPPYVH